MSRYRFTDPATSDFDKILDELERRSRTAARRVAGVIRDQCERYAGNPLLGILRDDLAPDLRCFLAFRYVVFYTIIPDGIEVTRIFHGHQDIDSESFLPEGTPPS
jgi:toxin ParE1/3/4